MAKNWQHLVDTAPVRSPSNPMHRKKKAGFNLVIFQDLVNGSDFLEIMESKRVLERWLRP